MLVPVSLFIAKLEKNIISNDLFVYFFTNRFLLIRKDKLGQVTQTSRAHKCKSSAHKDKQNEHIKREIKSLKSMLGQLKRKK